MVQKKSGLLLILAWAAGLIGFVMGVIFEPMWFARFGSLVVLFSLVGEYALLHNELDRLYVSLEKVEDSGDIPDLSPSKWHHKKVWLSHLTVVFGTLIWGFGDLLL
jgi:hypothetical protein